MRTTLDIPDRLFRELKARAAMEGLKLKDLLATLIESGLRQPSQGETVTPRIRSPLPVIGKATTAQPIPALSNAEPAQIELDEDLAKGERQSAAPEAPPSAYDLMKDYCGIVDSGVDDLASNPKHMEQFGRDSMGHR